MISPKWSDSEKARREGYDLVSDEDKYETVIDDRAWLEFCFFYASLVILVLWYVFLYSSAGFINPEWTQVFE
jgi:hypothetical protein